MIPVVRVLFERALARRESLLGLVEVVPGDYWTRSAGGDSWTAYTHLAHALTADNALADLADLLAGGAGPVRLTAAAMYAERERCIQSSADLSPAALVVQAGRSRDRLTRQFGLLAPADLDRVLVWELPGGSLPAEVSISLFAYLEQWAVHDSGHEGAIRAAISTTPDLSAVAHIRRMR